MNKSENQPKRGQIGGRKSGEVRRAGKAERDLVIGAAARGGAPNRVIARVLQVDEGTVRHVIARDQPPPDIAHLAKRLAQLTRQQPNEAIRNAVQRLVEEFGQETVAANLGLAEQTPGIANPGGWLRTACRERWAAAATHERKRSAWE